MRMRTRAITRVSRAAIYWTCSGLKVDDRSRFVEVFRDRIAPDTLLSLPTRGHVDDREDRRRMGERRHRSRALGNVLLTYNVYICRARAVIYRPCSLGRPSRALTPLAIYSRQCRSRRFYRFDVNFADR